MNKPGQRRAAVREAGVVGAAGRVERSPGAWRQEVACELVALPCRRGARGLWCSRGSRGCWGLSVAVGQSLSPACSLGQKSSGILHSLSSCSALVWQGDSWDGWAAPGLWPCTPHPATLGEGVIKGDTLPAFFLLWNP